MRTHRIIRTLCAAAVAIPIACYAGYLVLADWNSQAHLRAAAQREDAEQRRWDRIHDAAERLQSHGAQYAHIKGIEFRWIDLSQFNASVSHLKDLRALADLANVRPGAGTLFIRLGPNIDASILPVLRDVKNLEVLDPNGARLTKAELDGLLASLPNCRLGQVDVN